jgi:hypothetical protein
LRLVKRLMILGAIGASILAATAPHAAADVPCGFSWSYTPDGRYGWNIRNCDNYGKWQRLWYDDGTSGGLLGECYYIAANSIKVGSSVYEPVHLVNC